MSLTLLQNANFGYSRANVTGSTGVGYRLMDAAGNLVLARTTVGVYQLTSGSGLYAANVTYPNSFNGQIMWDCPAVGVLSASYATENYDFRIADTWSETNGLTGSIQSLLDVGYGNWQIVGNQMVFYASGSTSTAVATFNLLDDVGNPTMDAVFKRVRT